MKTDKKISFVVIGLVIGVTLIGLAAGVNPSNNSIVIDTETANLEVTIYNVDHGVVKEYRAKYLPAGRNNVLWEGVAPRIDTTSVRLKAVDSEIEVVKPNKPNIQYDVVRRDKILKKYIDKDIVAYLTYGDKKEMIEGTLLSYSGDQLIIRDKAGMIQIIDSNNLVLPELPEGLIMSLAWILDVTESRNHTLELSYITSGMTWDADYVVTNKNDSKLDLNGWITVTNNAGTTFNDTALKLVAGDVHRAPEQVVEWVMAIEEGLEAPGTNQFEEEALFEYYL